MLAVGIGVGCGGKQVIERLGRHLKRPEVREGVQENLLELGGDRVGEDGRRGSRDGRVMSRSAPAAQWMAELRLFRSRRAGALPGALPNFPLDARVSTRGEFWSPRSTDLPFDESRINEWGFHAPQGHQSRTAGLPARSSGKLATPRPRVPGDPATVRPWSPRDRAAWVASRPHLPRDQTAALRNGGSLRRGSRRRKLVDLRPPSEELPAAREARAGGHSRPRPPPRPSPGGTHLGG